MEWDADALVLWLGFRMPAGLEGGTCFLRSHSEMGPALLQRGLLPPGQTASDVPCKAWRQVFQVNEMPERRLSEKEGQIPLWVPPHWESVCGLLCDPSMAMGHFTCF